MKEIILKTNKLVKKFKEDSIILKGINLDIYKNDFTIIMGSSGSGKSTLLYSLSGMDKPTSGEIYFNDKDISKMNQDALAIFRRTNCGFVFQQSYLLDNLNVMDNILASALLNKNEQKKNTIKRVNELIKQINLKNGIEKKYPNQISGGEAQRVGLIRAIINKPKVLFADEPTGALNSSTGKAVLDALSNANRTGQTVVMVTHDFKSALRGNRILYLKDGVINGELYLNEYTFDDEERSNELRNFLLKMGW